jgi:hypothetical protein
LKQRSFVTVRQLLESTSGQVSNAEALLAGHHGFATLTWGGVGSAPMIILDYGRDVGGIPVFDVVSVSGTPTLRAIYSEGQPFLLPNGDGAAPSGGGVVGGRVGNEIWGLGAYTGPLCQVESSSLPPTWTVTPQGLDVTGGTYSSYQAGDTWTDYTATLEVQIITNEASWLVRSSHSSGYRFVLGADNDTLSGFAPSNTTPNTLLAFQQNTNDQLGVVSLASLGIDIKPGTWHTVKAVVSGETVNTYLDGQLVLSFNVTEPKEQNSTGSVGLGNGSGAEALFRNLSVQAAGGQTLYTSTLVTNTVLDEFSTGTNAVASVIDGAKRDRYCWSGDLAVAGPLIYYTNAHSEFIKGMLGLLGSFHRSNPNNKGEVSTTLAPQLKPGLTAGDNLPGGNPPGLNFWSASYSTYFLPNLCDYYLYTGDLDFVRQEWPSAEQELAYLKSITNATSNGPVAFSLSSVYASFPVISPFISGFEAWARFEVGDATGALDLIRTVWGHMQKGSPFYSGGVWETLAPDATPKFGPGTSLAHPWSFGPYLGAFEVRVGCAARFPGLQNMAH